MIRKMRYIVNGEIFSQKILKEGLLFKGFYIIDNIELKNNGFNGILKNYLKYNFEFYLDYNGMKLDYGYDFERNLRFLVQDNLEIELSFFSLINNNSIVLWINSVNEYKLNNKNFNFCNYLINDNFCWNFYKKSHEIIDKNPEIFYGYKFRLSNCEIIPGTGIISDYVNLIEGKELNLDLDNEEILSQIDYYKKGLYLENNGFIDEAFLNFYKIIEVEEEKIRSEYKLKDEKIMTVDFIKNIEIYFSKFSDDFINMEDFRQKVINNNKKLSGGKIRKEIFTKYNLSGNIKHFIELNSIRGIFSHSNRFEYIQSLKFENCKKFAFEIIINKLSK